jgi:hypothetical protein
MRNTTDVGGASLLAVAQWGPAPVLSIVLPVDHRRPQPEGVAHELKSLATPCRAVLEDELGLDHSEAAAVVAGLRSGDVPLPTRAHLGAAWFVSATDAVCVPLPFAPAPRCRVGRVVDLVPSLREFQRNRRFFLLTLAAKHVALYEGDALTMAEQEVEGLPTSLADELWFVRREPTLNLHGATAGGGSPGAAYGGSDPRDLRKDDLRRYLHAVEHAVRPVLTGRAEPLVIAAVEHVAAMYTDLTDYPFLAGVVAGSPPEQLTDPLHAAAFALVEALPDGSAAARARWTELLGTGLATADPAEIEAALAAGRVASLLVAADASVDVTPRAEPGDEAATRLVTAAVGAGLEVVVVDVDTVDTSTLPQRVGAILRY